jgi:hypothetical protein
LMMREDVRDWARWRGGVRWKKKWGEVDEKYLSVLKEEEEGGGNFRSYWLVFEMIDEGFDT